jgi:GNAT superfamily N-acetyltransferase
MTPRLARPDEAAALWRIRNLSIRHGCQAVYPADVIAAWTPDALPEGYFEAIRGNPFFVVEDPLHGVAATGFLDLANGSVEAIFTLPSCYGKGYASAIMQAIVQEARQRGFRQLTLAATPNACGFYLRHGFSVVKESLYHSALAGAALPCVEMKYDL